MLDTEKAFNPLSHLIQIKTSQGPQDYLPVQWRLAWFREVCPDGQIETEVVHLDFEKEVEAEVFVWNAEKRRSEKIIKRAKGIAVFKATVRDGKGGTATGTKQENAASFADFIEKSETGAVGRALAMLGYNAQYAPEFDEGEERLADAPITRPTPQQERKPSYDPDVPATAQQLDTVRKLYKQLGETAVELDGLSFGACAQLLRDLPKRLQAKQQAS